MFGISKLEEKIRKLGGLDLIWVIYLSFNLLPFNIGGGCWAVFIESQLFNLAVVNLLFQFSFAETIASFSLSKPLFFKAEIATNDISPNWGKDNFI